MGDSGEVTDPEAEVDKLSGDISSSSERVSAKKMRIHREASRRLAAMGGTMPDLEDIPRRRVDNL